MLKKFVSPVAAILALAIAVPALAGGANCGSAKGASATAWAGACLQRTASGAVTVAEVVAGSPAAKAGLRAGDVVTAVNGYRLADAREREMCSSSAECNVGSKVTYTVQRGSSKREIAVKLVKMPADAANKFANREASFDPTLAALVMPAAR